MGNFASTPGATTFIRGRITSTPKSLPSPTPAPFGQGDVYTGGAPWIPRSRAGVHGSASCPQSAGTGISEYDNVRSVGAALGNAPRSTVVDTGGTGRNGVEACNPATPDTELGFPGVVTVGMFGAKNAPSVTLASEGGAVSVPTLESRGCFASLTKLCPEGLLLFPPRSEPCPTTEPSGVLDTLGPLEQLPLNVDEALRDAILGSLLLGVVIGQLRR